jgi:hypothetical protein
MYSSLLDAGIGLGFGDGCSGPYLKFGTMHTATTEATSFIPSEWPSMTRTEGAVYSALNLNTGQMAI